MKKLATFICCLVMFCYVHLVHSSDNIKTFTGRVKAIDPKGTAIVVSEMIGKSEMVVGVIVTPETVVKIGKKKADLKDLKIGDRVTITYERTHDLFAKTIVKK
ncbi:MAG: hypothetical protein N2513_03775 [Deltaproteobacteria bacterium]|nr:hypothetical protein [Deltaproteobacteria bacterium]